MDFLIIASDEPTCLAHRLLVTNAMELLGFNIAWKKVTAPSTICTFLGITIDSVKMELSLPLEKVQKLHSFLSELMAKGYASKKELERSGGLVSHCSYVIRGGRTFSRRIFDLAASYSRQASQIPLDEEILKDFKWWLAFCNVFNGRACIIKDTYSIPMYSDSSFAGFGAWMGLDWLYGYWDDSSFVPVIPSASSCAHRASPPVLEDVPKNINVYELWPVVVGLKRWAPHFRNSRVHIVTDNMQVLAMLNTGRSCNKTCMAWLREIFLVCFINNIDVFATYLCSADNVMADALSRAAYTGMISKCSVLLDSANMCCSSPTRSTDGTHPSPPATSTRCSPGILY